MDYFSCIARRTRRQTDLYIERLFRCSSGHGDEKGLSGSGASLQSKGRKRTKSRYDSWSRDNAVEFAERELDEQDVPNMAGFHSVDRRKVSRLEEKVSESDVVFLGECASEKQRDSVSFSSQRQTSSEGPKADKGTRVLSDEVDSVEVIEIDDSDDCCDEDLEHSQGGLTTAFKGFDTDINVDEDQNEEIGVEGGDDFVDKGENFDNVGCDPIEDERVESGSAARNLGFDKPVTIDLVGDSESSQEEQGEKTSIEVAVIGSKFGFDDDLSSSTDSQDDDSVDEDFKVEESEIFSSEDSCNSYDNEEISEAGEEERSGSKEAEKERIDDSFSADAAEFGDYQENLGCSKLSEEAKIDNTKPDGAGGKDNVNVTERGHSSVSLQNSQREKGDSTEISKSMDNKKGREANKETEKIEAKANDKMSIDAQKRKVHLNKFTGVKEGKLINKGKKGSFCCNAERLGTEPMDTGNPSVAISKNQKKLEPSNTLFKGVEHKHKAEEEEKTGKDGDKINDRVDKNVLEEKARAYKKTCQKEREFRIQSKSARPKELHIIELLANCIWGKRNAIKDNSILLEEKLSDIHRQDTQPPAGGETLPLKFTFGVKKPEAVEKTQSEMELDMLWEEMETCLRFEEIGSLIGNRETNETGGHKGSPVNLCKHDFFLDEQIGIYCKICLFIATEIKDVLPPMLENVPLEESGRRSPFGEVDASVFDEIRFNKSGGHSDAVCYCNEGTVWDIIPEVKESMYPHQQEGFEFIWTNLAGTIDLHKLKNADPNSEGGCIISHAPGTGKTRLAIMFLHTYLEIFPKCQPVIIAPAGLLFTWEDEFRKWDIGIPFHNLNNLDFSGKEHVAAINNVKMSRHQCQNKDFIRMVKLFSWCNGKSILGISYSLYEKLAGEKSKASIETKKSRSERGTLLKSEVMGKVLRDKPGLLVLDEGHTPRNHRSQIWKVLSEIKTEKRIILSGTPFQNNFLELYNTLCLVKPSFPDSIPQELKKFCQRGLMQEKKACKGVRWEQVSSFNSTGISADKIIHQLKFLMAPFVHVHKGSILQKNLPGLRDCVVILNPGNVQKRLLESIEWSQNTFKFEHKLALVSIHPSLFLCCSQSEKEESVVNRDQLEKLKLNPRGGVKTRFLVEFVQLCEALNEKVLVFSQYIDPLYLIMDQLISIFNWSEGKEVLHMHGKLDQKQRHSLIHGFNDPNSQVKILLASTKACSEGINLVGASRVVLLDVVWNPSVERQAISRAFRLGQKRVVYTYHLITQGTTECQKYCKQAEKDRISELVFSAGNNENDKLKSSAVSEDKVLDVMVQHDKLKDMFNDIIFQPKERDLVESFGS